MAIFVVLMMTRRLSTLLSLVFLSVVIGVLVGVPVSGKNSIITGIFSNGAVLLAGTMVAVVMGGWLGVVMDETGIAATLVRKAVEFGGDRPYAVAAAVWVVAILVGTVTGSAPAAMLIGLIGIPSMLALGVPPAVAASVIVLGLSAGIPFQLAGWQYFSQVLKLTPAQVQSFELRLFPVVVVGGLLFLFVQSRIAGTVHAWAASADQSLDSGTEPSTPGSAWSSASKEQLAKKNVPWYAVLTPLVPIVLVLGFKVDIIPALFVGVLYGILTTRPSQFNSLMLRTAYRGFEVSAAPAYLFIAIGMLLTAVRAPGIIPALQPIVSVVAPHSVVVFAIVFAILGPLSLYRGPLNVYGMGVGIAAVFLTLHTYPALVVLGLMASFNQILGVSDPTSTQTVWSAEYAGVRPETVMLRTIPFTWLISAGGVILTAVLYFH